jgi:hypothetical protein
VGCGHMWCRLVCVHAHAISPACVLVMCSHVMARCVHAARCWAVCVAVAGRSLSWCAGWLEGGGSGVGCGHMWCSLMRVHALAISPVCVLGVCSHVLARCPHAVRCWAVCVAMAGGH